MGRGQAPRKGGIRMTEMPPALLSSSPHAHSGAAVPRIMLDVIIALLPALGVALWRFGWDAARLVVICVSACVLAEWTSRRIMRRDPGIGDLSAVVTGLLLAFNLPPSLPGWMALVGCLFAVVVAKQIFGGIGHNPFNPALIGRVVLVASFPAAMTAWTPWAVPHPVSCDAVTSATPLGLVKTSLQSGAALPFVFDAQTARQMLIGATNGCVGETSALALLLGGAYLLYRRCIYWQTPVFYLLTVYILALILRAVNPDENLPPLFHLLSGGLMLGAVYMATDMVTTPVTRRGMAAFGLGCGLLTMVIRKWGGYPEGVSYSILLMNAVTPLINRATRPRVLGTGRRR